MVTKSQNGLHATRVLGVNRGEKHGAAKLTEAIVREIRRLYAAGVTQRELAERHGVDRSCISLIVRRETWKHIATGG
jgi:hypothetical protein